MFLKALPLLRFQPASVGGRNCLVPGVRLCVGSVLGSESRWIEKWS